MESYYGTKAVCDQLESKQVKRNRRYKTVVFCGKPFCGHSRGKCGKHFYILELMLVMKFSNRQLHEMPHIGRRPYNDRMCGYLTARFFLILGDKTTTNFSSPFCSDF